MTKEKPTAESMKGRFGTITDSTNESAPASMFVTTLQESKKPKITTLDESYGLSSQNADGQVQNIPLTELHPFKNHPFRVEMNDTLRDLAKSIAENGVLSPAMARPREEGGYELVSGHRRKAAAELAGLSAIPVIVREMDDDTATIFMVDSNKQRENILPSEKAWAYRMKMDALKHQGKSTSSQVETKRRSDEILAAESDDSRATIQRFIRLTYLVPELIKMVDDGKIAFNPAVELSYLSKEKQRILLDAMDAQQCSPSMAQAKKLKTMEQDGGLESDAIFALLSAPKENQKEKVVLDFELLCTAFPEAKTPKQMEGEIYAALKDRHKKLLRQRQRDDVAR